MTHEFETKILDVPVTVCFDAEDDDHFDYESVVSHEGVDLTEWVNTSKTIRGMVRDEICNYGQRCREDDAADRGEAMFGRY